MSVHDPSPRPLEPQPCGHKLCGEESVHAVEVFNPWSRCVFNMGPGLPNVPENRRSYALCEQHYRRYFPRGLGYLGRAESVALRIQCREATYAAEEVCDG